MAAPAVTFADNVLQFGRWEGQENPSPMATPTPIASATPLPSSTPLPTPTLSLPKTQLRVRKANETVIEEQVMNGSFESGLTGWEVAGDVALISGADEFTAPFAESHMVRIGRAQNPGRPASENRLNQRIPAGSTSLQFAYHFFSNDTLGFDEPGFVVKAGERVLLQRWASEVDWDFHGGTIGNTGWQVAVVDLSDVPSGSELEFEFLSGNDDWNLPTEVEHQSWVYLDAVSTNQAVLRPLAELVLVGQNALHGYVQIGENPVQRVELGKSLALTGINQGQYTVKYWGENEDGVETPNSTTVWVDTNFPTAIEDLHVEQTGQDRFFLRWTSPRDLAPWVKNAWASRAPMKYDVRYMTEDPGNAEIDDLLWQVLSPLGTDSGPIASRQYWWSPRPVGEMEIYEVELPTVTEALYLAVWSVDAAGNYSPRSNVFTIDTPEPTLEFYETDDNVVEFLLTAATPSNEAEAFVEYTIEYSRFGEEGMVTEVITGQFTAWDWQHRLGGFFLGTCSEGICVPHMRPPNSNILLTVSLSAEGYGSRTLQAQLPEGGE